jgi:GNAT superfamily N-acetyltransferase
LAALYASLSGDDCRRRFFSPGPPPASWLDRWLTIGERGGFGLVAVRDGSSVVGDVGCFPLANGNVELAVTVSPSLRGERLGARLFDAALAEASDRGIDNVEAEMLLENQPMFGLIRSRPYAVLFYGEGRIRVVVRAGEGMPTWPADDARPRLLVEMPGGRWAGFDGAEASGWQVAACPGPSTARPCPVGGGGCALLDGADAVVCSLVEDDPLAQAVRRGHESRVTGPPLLSAAEALGRLVAPTG